MSESAVCEAPHFSASYSVGGGQIPPRKPVVYTVLPRADSKACFHSAISFAHSGGAACEVYLDKDAQGAAFLRNHNGPFHNALNLKRMGEPFTHFAMIHADVAPPFAWIDTLLEEMHKHKAQVIATVIPFRDFSGLTSTGIDNPEDEFAPRRLTLAECHKLPETFSAKDTEHPDRALLINTGLWLCELNHDWCNDVLFDFKVRIGRVQKDEPQPNGGMIPAGFGYFEQESEDWRFSRWLHKNNVPYVATRKVPVEHIGEWSWSNRSPVFDLRNGKAVTGADTDEIYQAKMVREAGTRRQKELDEAREAGRQEGLREARQHNRSERDLVPSGWVPERLDDTTALGVATFPTVHREFVTEAD